MIITCLKYCAYLPKQNDICAKIFFANEINLIYKNYQQMHNIFYENLGRNKNKTSRQAIFERLKNLKFEFTCQETHGGRILC